MEAKIAATEDEASCLVASLVAEISAPCPCNGTGGLRIAGTTHDARPITITIDAKAHVLYIDGMAQGEVDAIVQRRCPLRLRPTIARGT